MQVIACGTTGFLDRRHSVALDVGLADDPAEPNADHEDQNNEPAHADPRESAPLAMNGFGLIGHAGPLRSNDPLARIIIRARPMGLRRPLCANAASVGSGSWNLLT